MAFQKEQQDDIKIGDKVFVGHPHYIDYGFEGVVIAKNKIAYKIKKGIFTQWVYKDNVYKITE
jgi:hypothetical protein